MIENRVNSFTGKKVILRFIKEYTLPYKGKIFFSIMLMIATAILTSLNAYILKPIIDKTFFNKNIDQLYGLAGFLTALFILKAICTYAQRLLLSKVEMDISADLQHSLFKKVVKFKMSLFDSFSSGKLISYFMNDIGAIRGAVSSLLINIGREVFTLIFLIAVMFWRDWKMALISFVGFPLAFLPLINISRKLRKLAHRIKYQNEVLTSHLNDSFNGIRTIKSYGGESREINSFNHILDNLNKMAFETTRRSSLGSPLMEMFGGLAVIVAIIYGGTQVINNNSTPGNFFSFLTALLLLYKPAKSLSGINAVMQSAIVSLQHIFSLIDEPNEEDNGGKISYISPNPLIKFENVSFNYIDQSGNERHVLKNFNFTLKPKTKTAIVGQSGGGKSTIANLVMKFYNPASGHISIDGVDMQLINTDYLRKNIAYVGQDVFLFDDTIKNNILYGLENVSDDELHEAIRNAKADYISLLAEGINTNVKHTGALSGGQKQLISIIRAMLKKSPIIILDEATSALDNASEKQVRDAMKNLIEDKTVLMIAHRLSSISGCDFINVIENGIIIEEGSHVDLIDKNGIYKHLWDIQKAEI